MAFEWGKTDNSPTTRIRYDLEGKHWMRAFNENLKKNAPKYNGGGGTTGGHFEGLIVSLFNLAVHICALIIYGAFMLCVFLIKLIFNAIKKKKNEGSTTTNVKNEVNKKE